MDILMNILMNTLMDTMFIRMLISFVRLMGAKPLDCVTATYGLYIAVGKSTKTDSKCC